MVNRMYRFYLSLLISLLITTTSDALKDEDLKFPDGFAIGAATSAYQIEGAWNVSDKGENCWDRFTHTKPQYILNEDNGDVACDSYHKYNEDVQLLKFAGIDHYRFSISWSRILPTGYSNVVSKEGVKYYHDLLAELEKYNITPAVTLHHYDHPQIFEDIGGWANEEIVDLFGDYARVVFREFGDKVKLFFTINEPNILCESEYSDGEFPPALKNGKHAEYLCNHNTLKAHARAYHIYNDEFRERQKGKVSIVLNCAYYYSKNKNDTVSNEVAFQFNCGKYAHPIFSKTGDYPDIVKRRIAENSKYEGLERSRLPIFSKKWINYIKGSADFFALNHYSTGLVEPAPKPNYTIYVRDIGLLYSYDTRWPPTFEKHHKIVPEGFRDLLKKIKKEYKNPIVHVTENGMACADTTEDNLRIKYLYLYMRALLTAIKKDGCNIRSYYIWSLMDNFEWNEGYSKKYGMVQVDFNSTNRTRTPKKSLFWLKTVTSSRKLQPLPKH